MLRGLPYLAVELGHLKLPTQQFRPRQLTLLKSSLHLAQFLRSKLQLKQLSLIEAGDTRHLKYLEVQWIAQKRDEELGDLVNLPDCSPNLQLYSLQHQTRLPLWLIQPTSHRYSTCHYSQIFTQIVIFD